MTRWASCDAVERHPEKLGGALIFRGTRVPVSALFENWQVRAVLDDAVETDF